MEIKGEWLFCEDGIVRPVLRGRFLSADGEWISTELLIDTGADCTVLNVETAQKLGFVPLQTEDAITGLGGATDAVAMQTELQLFRETGAPVTFRSRFTALTDPFALDHPRSVCVDRGSSRQRCLPAQPTSPLCNHSGLKIEVVI